jgi:hypothetical protein
VYTFLKGANRSVISLVDAVVKHSLFVQELAVNPLQRNPRCRYSGSNCEIIVPFDLEPEAVPDITSRVDNDANGGVKA